MNHYRELLGCPIHGEPDSRLFFHVAEVRLHQGTLEERSACCEDPLREPGWYEVRRRESFGRARFHWHVRKDGWVSFRRPGDVEAHDARVTDWRFLTETPDEPALSTAEAISFILQGPKCQ